MKKTIFFTFYLLLFIHIQYVFAENNNFTRPLLKKICDYAKPGIGVDKVNYHPYDHIRLYKELGICSVKGNYTAPSKNSVYLGFLLRLALDNGDVIDFDIPITEEEEAIFKDQKIKKTNKNIALFRMKKNLESILKYQKKLKKEAEAGKIIYTGFMPWLTITKKGKFIEEVDRVPILDSALSSWAFAGIIGGLSDDENKLAVDIVSLTHNIIENQDYTKYWDNNDKKLYGEFNVKTGQGNKNYYIQDLWTEDLLVVLWMILHNDIPEADALLFWDTLKSETFTYKTEDEENILVPKGYIMSNHEIGWGMNFVPIEDTGLLPLFYNSQYLQADFANKKGNPGFLTVSYDGFGAYTKIGIPDLCQYPEYVQKDDTSALYGTCMGLSIWKQEITPWIESFLNRADVHCKYCTYESIGPEGVPDIITADSQFNIGLSLLGGIRKEVLTYLQDKDKLDLFYDLFSRKHSQILKDNNISQLKIPEKPFPFPKLNKSKDKKYLCGMQKPVFDIIPNLTINKDDRHGMFVYKVGDKSTRWRIYNNQIEAEYNISEDTEKERRYAWIGTYMGTNRPFISGFDKVKVTFRVFDYDQAFNLEFKRENTNLVRPIVVFSSDRGKLSKDRKWKTVTYNLKHRNKYVNLPFTYLSVSVDDPYTFSKYNYKNKGKIVIKKIELLSNSKQMVNIDNRIKKYKLKKNKKFNLDFKENIDEKDFQRVKFIDSGALGEATEEHTKEEDGIMFVEFEDVNTYDGFSGIWAKIKKVNLKKYKYFSFDIKKPLYFRIPKHVRIEFKGKRKKVNYYINLRKYLKRNKQTCRVKIPLSEGLQPGFLRPSDVQYITFVHENWESKRKDGAYLVSNLIFSR